MKQFFDQALLYQIDPEYKTEFLRQLNLENAKKSYVIARLGLFFLVVLLILDYLRQVNGDLWNNPVHVWLFFNHCSFIAFLIPFAIYRFQRDTIQNGAYPHTRRLTQITIDTLALTLLPMTILGIMDRGALSLYAIYVLICNLFLNLSHKDRIGLNIFSLIVMLAAISVTGQDDLTVKFIRVLECLGLQLPTFVFSTFQHNLKIRQFTNEKLLEEQKNLIEREKQRSENLLLNILPAPVAEELKERGHVQPRYFDQVSVLFADFKDFSLICTQLAPEQLISDLNHCFGQFDRIVTRLGLERVKTIGDCYMCVGGLSRPNTDHAVRMVQAAFAMQAFLGKWRQERIAFGLPVFEARIGIHSGPVVGGIVGTTKFAFDIWGETVNIAARMEGNGEPNRVNISGDTYALVRNYFPCEYRGKIPIKNIGEAEMYFVLERGSV